MNSIKTFFKNFYLAIFIFVIVLLCFNINLNKVSATGASLYLSPSSGTYVIGGKFSVSVKVNTGGAIVNATEGAISFDKNLLEISGVSKSGSIFPFWTTEPSFSNSAGTIKFGGGLPPPAYSGTAGHIFKITFKAKKSGKAQVRFVSGAVLANDGKGTNILASMGSGSYIISPKVTSPKSSGSDKKIEKIEYDYNKPKILSPTHPDQNKWYNTILAKFEWKLSDNIIGVSVNFDNDSITDPGPKSDGLFDKKEYKDNEDGIWYLHLKFKDNKKWGTIENYKVMIDTEPPLPFEIKITPFEVGEWPELSFEAKDEKSGIDKYQIYIGNLESKPFEKNADNPTLKISNLNTGEHTALVKAIDKAGNERIASIVFNIKAIDAPKILNYPQEIKSSDKFYISGTAIADAKINIFIQKGNSFIASSSVKSDINGNWINIFENNFSDGRYIVWAEAVNKNGIKSSPSARKTFLVSPPIFAVVGSFVINYFTVFVSLLFIIILIIILIFYLVGLIRKKLKKETVEIEQVLHKNLLELSTSVDKEFIVLNKLSKSIKDNKEKLKIKIAIKKNINNAENKILKEIKDVENILK